MVTEQDQVFRDALQLDTAAPTELLDRIIDTLDRGSDTGVEEAWMQEIKRRASEIESGAVATESWEVVRDRLTRSEIGETTGQSGSSAAFYRT